MKCLKAVHKPWSRISETMAFDEALTHRIRAALGEGAGLSEKRMTGGVCFFLNGNMVCGADRSKEGKRRFMFRVGKGNAAALPQGVPMILGDRQMPGFYFVDGERCNDELLQRWLDVALSHARSLPPK
ncbi:TfoX/Sxy family protein [Sphingomonas sp.]|uniref:TfoX/Sxy family protein n=1 Tax=Sphingomonas sp. TaxID=28214 RepID=UPI00307EF85A